MGYFVPAINVQKGNPKGIRCLKDMTRPEIRIALANSESVFVGMLGAEIVDKAFHDQERKLFRENIVTYTEDFSKLASLLVPKQVDAVIGFSYLNNWFPDKIDTIKLSAAEVQRIGVGQAALLNYSANKPWQSYFLIFLTHKKVRIYLRDTITLLPWKKPVNGSVSLTREGPRMSSRTIGQATEFGKIRQG
jgi:molybdate transport system substrate-binding protein